MKMTHDYRIVSVIYLASIIIIFAFATSICAMRRFGIKMPKALNFLSPPEYKTAETCIKCEKNELFMHSILVDFETAKGFDQKDMFETYGFVYADTKCYDRLLTDGFDVSHIVPYDDG
ncbi:MAG: hypothetical protein KKD39_01830 [Candidatus Altiarchaeota archaeon]|nr:hypothetical protein [Candidatus Altiarchaeota archaeon]